MEHGMLSGARGAWKVRAFGLLMVVLGLAGWWYNWHLAETEGRFYIKMCVFVPLAVGGGLLVAVRPDWIGPWRSDSSPAHKTALIALIGFMAVASGVDMYRLKTSRFQERPVVIRQARNVPPAVKVRPVMTTNVAALTAPSLTFRSQSYRLGSFNQRNHATWEFVSDGETVNNWTKLLTVVDRPDAKTREDLDRLAEGLMATYKSHGAKILLAKTLQEASGTPFNYMVAAFEEPASQRYELNFVKMTMGEKNAVVLIHGVRVSDGTDYLGKAKEYLNRNSSEIGRAMEKMTAPDVGKFTRREF